MAQALATRREVVREIVLPVGRDRYLDLHVVPLLEDGVRGVVSAFYDITRIRQLERVRKDFVANVSHELRTPLTAIKGCAETLLDGALEDPQAGLRFVQVISSHADRLARLLDDLLSLARLESEKLEVHWEVCSLRRVVESCAGAVTASAQKKQITLAVELPQDHQVRCDRKLVEQALINLLDNAVKYTGEGGRVRVSALPLHPSSAGAVEAAGRLQVLRPRGNATDERVGVEVQDTGMGIPSQDLSRVFERFYRVDKGRSRAQGGTGLGLSIVRHVLEAHGEGLYVVSELGHGSTFGFTLPIAPASG
jgi:two-component system phosphate regulon sensor histidine kinase PhoR